MFERSIKGQPAISIQGNCNAVSSVNCSAVVCAVAIHFLIFLYFSQRATEVFALQLLLCLMKKYMWNHTCANDVRSCTTAMPWRQPWPVRAHGKQRMHKRKAGTALFSSSFFLLFSGRPHPLGDATLLLQIVYVDEWLLLGWMDECGHLPFRVVFPVEVGGMRRGSQCEDGGVSQHQDEILRFFTHERKRCLQW